MTKPRPWPYYAMAAKKEAESAAKEIDRLGDVAEDALHEGNSYTTQVAIVKMRHLAAQIIAGLLAVENGVECEDCPFYEGRPS